MCDDVQCTHTSTLWRIFLGCGHSFHLQCNLPDISVCKICQEFLTSKAASLGEAANTAVHEFDSSSDSNQGTVDEEVSGNDENDSEEESSQDVDQEGETQNDTTNTQTVFNLISRVKAWRRFETSQS